MINSRSKNPYRVNGGVECDSDIQIQLLSLTRWGFGQPKQKFWAISRLPAPAMKLFRYTFETIFENILAKAVMITSSCFEKLLAPVSKIFCLSFEICQLQFWKFLARALKIVGSSFENYGQLGKILAPALKRRFKELSNTKLQSVTKRR